jgi:hypothetical protein
MKKLLSVVLLGAFLGSLGCTSSSSAPPKAPTTPAKPPDAKPTPP